MREINRLVIYVLCTSLCGILPGPTVAQPNILDTMSVGRAVQLINLESLNTSALEFSPTVQDSQLYYVSSLNTEGGTDPEISEPWFIWFRAPMEQGPTFPNSFYSFQPVGDQAYHLGPMCFLDGGRELIYTANPNRGYGLRKKQLPLQLYRVRKNGAEWGEPERLTFVNREADYCHPSWDEMRKRLYFSSDRAGGFGGMDIYYVERNGETWSEPVNAGRTVNTEADEVFPYITGTGALFYSSNRGESLDIFLEIREEDGEHISGKLPEPFSSEGDDLGFYLSPDHKSGYLSSNRPGGWGKDDLYAFHSSIDLLDRHVPKHSWQFIVWDERADQPIQGAELRAFPVDEEGIVDWPNAFERMEVREGGSVYTAYRLKDPRKLKSAEAVTGEGGQASIDLAKQKDWKLYFTATNYRDVEWNPPERMHGDPIVIRMKSSACNPYRIEIVNEAGHAIPSAKLSWLDACGGGMEGESLSGCLYPQCTYTVVARAKGYSADTVEFVSGTGSSDTTLIEIRLESLREALPEWTRKISRGNVIVMENIYYNYNEASIRPGAADDLELLARIMKKYPSMQVELIAHTDSRGDKYYNLKLSLRRAESAKEFLVDRGINPDRIRALGYGESQIRNRCEDGVKCTEEEHEYNRRTEVRITSMDEEVNIRYRKNLPEK